MRVLALFLCASAGWAAMVQPTLATRLDLTFLPPDIPPVDICNASPEIREEGELQEDTGADDNTTVDTEYLRFVRSDIRRYMQADAEAHFDFIQALITRQVELDPDFSVVDEHFARIDLFVAANRLDGLRESRLLDALHAQISELTNNQIVRLARLYFAGLGGDEQAHVGQELLVEAAYQGNASALMDVLRLQLAGHTPENWDLLPEDTASIAFGGMIGQFNRGLCDRAERMAREYTSGEILRPNPELAFAWRKFAADMGGAAASWRIVERQLSATADQQNDEMLLHYLRKAFQNGFSVLPEELDTLRNSGAQTEEDIRAFFGRNYTRVGHAKRRSATRHLQLDVVPIPQAIEADSPLLQYLYDVSTWPSAPPGVHARLAEEILLRKGRWAGREEAMEYLRWAVQGGDADAMLLLSELVIAAPSTPGAFAQAERLLLDAAAHDGGGSAMKALDRYYRCQHPDAPILPAARVWANSRILSDLDPLNISAADLARLDPLRDPEAIARLQSDAVRGHGPSRGYLLQYLQSDVRVAQSALSYWAAVVSSSDRAIEDFATSEYELALTAAERSAAIELLRRVYLHVRAPVALELAVALVEHAGRDPAVAREIEGLLSFGAQRAEGASLRLLQRLKGIQDSEFFEEHAKVIQDRGDFLANMIAAPFVPDDVFDTYMARAISVMNCTTKDVNEIADAYVRRGRAADAAHWLRIGLNMEDGNVLSRLGLSPRQMAEFDSGVSPRLDEHIVTAATQNTPIEQLYRSYFATSDRSETAFDPDAAARSLSALLLSKDQIAALRMYRGAHKDIQERVQSQVDLPAILRRAAEGGDIAAQLDFARHLRTSAANSGMLAASADWLERSAMGGNSDAMVELGQALAMGLGRPVDRRLAVIWLEKAESLGNAQARDWITILTAAGLE